MNKMLTSLILVLLFIPVRAIEPDSIKVKLENSVELRNPSNLHPVIIELTNNYNNVVEHCGTPGRPAFLCSGIIIRATSKSEKYHNWDPSPRNITSGGVSYSYLRKDITFRNFVHGKRSGIIYYPSMLKPEGKGRAEVLCSFPTDGWTSGRNNKGCGIHNEYPTSSMECQQQGILKADAWFTHYVSVSTNISQRWKHQCGFNVGVKTPNSAQIFNESIKAQIKIQAQNNNDYNELIIAVWDTDEKGRVKEPEKLPIQAFFYIDDAGNGYEEALYYQKDYFETTGILVPIIAVSLPATATGDIKFMYNGMMQNIVECVLE